MNEEKGIDFKKVYSILSELLDNQSLPLTDRILLYRFVDKLKDSEKFEGLVNRNFNALYLLQEKDGINESIENNKSIFLPCRFYLKPIGNDNWELYLDNSLFLDKLSAQLARKISKDINIAYLIKSRRKLSQTKN